MIGGQALIEGIMMLGPDKSAVVVRTKDGLKEKIEDRPKASLGFSLKKLPEYRSETINLTIHLNLRKRFAYS